MVQLGVHVFRTSITCLNDLSTRRKPKADEKDPQPLDAIREIMTPQSQAKHRLRTKLAYTKA
jgi:hypothetical protein